MNHRAIRRAGYVMIVAALAVLAMAACQSRTSVEEDGAHGTLAFKSASNANGAGTASSLVIATPLSPYAWSSALAVPSEVSFTTSIARAANGDIYLLAPTKLRIYRYSRSNGAWATLTSFPTGYGTYTRGLSTYSDGDILFVGYSGGGGGSRAYRYDVGGTGWGSATDFTNEPINSPQAAAVDHVGRILTAFNNDEGRIRRWTASLSSNTIVATAPNGVNDRVRGLDVRADGTIVVGIWNSTANSSYVQEWNGSTWSAKTALPTGSGSIRGLFARHADDGYTVSDSNDDIYSYTARRRRGWCRGIAPCCC